MSRLQELLDLGFDEMIDSSNVVLIEWGNAVEGLLPPDYLEVEMSVERDDARRVAFRPRGGWAAREARLREATGAWAQGEE
jgi:tRNA A37 threonylcarbamoyladenosine biosynthesis protein TsaE